MQQSTFSPSLTILLLLQSEITTNNKLIESNNKKELTLTNTKHALSVTFSVCPNKICEGRNGTSHCPLPKVVVWSEEESLKLSINQWHEEYLPMVSLPVPDESSSRATFIFPRSFYRTPIEIIIPDKCDLLTAWLFPESVYPKNKAIEPTPISTPASNTDEELIGLLSCSSSSPMELALAAILRETRINKGVSLY